MLTTDLRLECEGPLYDGMFSFACIQCAVYPVGVPCLFLSVLWTHRKLITGRDPSLPFPQELRHIAILSKYYSNDAYYWEVVECVRRLMLSSVIVFTGEAKGARATWGTILSIAFSLACREWEPCQDTATQAFTFVCYWIVRLKEQRFAVKKNRSFCPPNVRLCLVPTGNVALSVRGGFGSGLWSLLAGPRWHAICVCDNPHTTWGRCSLAQA